MFATKSVNIHLIQRDTCRCWCPVTPWVTHEPMLQVKNAWRHWRNVSYALFSWINKDSIFCSRRQLSLLPATLRLWKSTRWSKLACMRMPVSWRASWASMLWWFILMQIIQCTVFIRRMFDISQLSCTNSKYGCELAHSLFVSQGQMNECLDITVTTALQPFIFYSVCNTQKIWTEQHHLRQQIFYF